VNEVAVNIKIIDDTSRRDCDAACGTDWSSSESIELASQQIRNRFSEEIRLEYFDLSRTIPDHSIAQWQQTIKEKSLSVPLLLINGQLRVAGQFDTRQIIDAVEAEIEMVP